MRRGLSDCGEYGAAPGDLWLQTPTTPSIMKSRSTARRSTRRLR